METDGFLLMLRNAAGFFAFATIEMTLLFIGISFLVGVINEFLPAEKVRNILSARKGHGYIFGAGLGALTPFCSCSSIPITVGLLKAGAGFGPTMSFLFASPLVNPIIVVLFITAFGLKIAIAYSILALGMAICAGYLLDRFNFEKHIKKDLFNRPIESSCCSGDKPIQAAGPVNQGIAFPVHTGSQGTPQSACCSAGDLFPVTPPSQGTSACCASAAGTAEAGRWRRIFREAVGQFRTFLPYILLGIGIGAAFHGFVPKDIVVRYAGPDNPLSIPVAAVIGIPLYVRVSTMIPVSISLIGKGMSLGTVVALVIGGAGASLPEMIMLKGLFRAPIITAFLISVFGIAVSAGFILNMI